MGQSASAKIFYGILIYDEYNWSDNYEVFEEYEMDVDNIINEFEASDVLESVFYGYEYGGHAIAIKDDVEIAYWEPKGIKGFLGSYADDRGFNEPTLDKIKVLNKVITALREKGFEIADPTWYLAASYG